MRDDLAIRTSATALVAAFEAAERDIRRAFGILVGAERDLNAAFGCGSRHGQMRVDATHSGYNDHFDNPDRAVARLAQQAWWHVVEVLELRRVMSISAWQKLDAQLSGKPEDMPAFTAENVEALAAQYMGDLPRLLAEAVAEVFEWLRPRGHTRAGRLKTNTQFELGRRAILPWVVEAAWSGDRFRVRYDSSQHLTALENVFSALGGDGQISKRHRSVLQDAIEAAPAGRGETDLFRFSAHKNGNLHLEFRRPDLVKRLNQIAGGARVKPRNASAPATGAVVLAED